MAKLFAFTLLGLLSSGEVFATDVIGGNYAELSIRAAQQIDGLSWKSAFVPVDIRVSRGSRKTAVAEIEGVFAKPDSTLLVQQVQTKVSAIGEFKLVVPLTGKTTEVRIVAVDPKGDMQSEILELLCDWPAVQRRITEQATPGRFRFTPGLNVSFINYQESQLPATVSERALTVAAGMSYHVLPSPFSLEAGGYYTPTALSKSRPETARFLDINLRMGYYVPGVKEPWSLSLQAGLYYTTMFVTNNAFGFTNMAGPQFFPVVRREFARGSAISVYAKVSPVNTATGPIFANREIAGGGAYIFELKNGHALPITLDVSSLLLNFRGVQVTSSTVSIGFGYGF